MPVLCAHGSGLDESSPRSSVPSEVGVKKSLRFNLPSFGYGSFNPLMLLPLLECLETGELVIDPKLIAVRYLKSYFIMDFFALIHFHSTLGQGLTTSTHPELKFVAGQFRRMHSRQVQHTFRFYSQHWRTWAACFIQAAWRRYYKRKMAEQHRREEEAVNWHSSSSSSRSSLAATIFASRFAANALRGVHRLRSKGGGGSTIVRLPKPPEPDFAID
ncbi:hypothetical protein GUJ93_ZPchr0458g22608 [Zizania palustris]|uniref:Uncharacterized protein n=1 Tax=Zizania palustris TaxID=103762 RepID=A0A8J5RL98_ZIZPA|nr:hypothetical protein GUJ93_ZPchr0458g22608 [Zizania palustris]